MSKFKVFYVLQDVTNGAFWSSAHRKFKGWLYADKFDTKSDAIEAAVSNNVGICKITEIIDTK